MKHKSLVLLVFAVAAVLAGLLVDAAAESVMLQFGWPDPSLLGGLLSGSLLLSAATVLVTFLALMRTRRAVKFTDEVVSELAKVTWPTRDETLRATTTVIFTSLFVAVLIFLYDQVWKFVADLVLYTEG